MILYGQDGRDFLQRFFPRKPMLVASNTIDIDALRHHRDSAQPVPRRGRPELVTLGRLNANKNFVGLVQSVLMFRRSFLDAVLKIIGDGPDRPNIEAATGEHLGRSVILTGRVIRRGRERASHPSADLFVMTRPDVSVSRSSMRSPTTCPSWHSRAGHRAVPRLRDRLLRR
jgi:glycosyltransferase involved in cell wall biosynthesis